MLIKTVQIVISNCGPSPSRLQALPTQRLVVQSTAPGVKAGQVSLTVHGTQQVHSPPEVGGGSVSYPPHFLLSRLAMYPHSILGAPAPLLSPLALQNPPALSIPSSDTLFDPGQGGLAAPFLILPPSGGVSFLPHPELRWTSAPAQECIAGGKVGPSSLHRG